MLRARRCAECGTLAVEQRATCPSCGADGGNEVTLSGRGRLVSWTVIRVPPARYASEAPYVVGLLQLEEGLRLTARLAGDPDRLAAGQAVALDAVDNARGPIFRAA